MTAQLESQGGRAEQILREAHGRRGTRAVGREGKRGRRVERRATRAGAAPERQATTRAGLPPKRALPPERGCPQSGLLTFSSHFMLPLSKAWKSCILPGARAADPG